MIKEYIVRKLKENSIIRKKETLKEVLRKYMNLLLSTIIKEYLNA